jgi:hypothetical protein
MRAHADAVGRFAAARSNPVHLQTARRFNAYVFTARLAAGQDDLNLLPFPVSGALPPCIRGAVHLWLRCPCVACPFLLRN